MGLILLEPRVLSHHSIRRPALVPFRSSAPSDKDKRQNTHPSAARSSPSQSGCWAVLKSTVEARTNTNETPGLSVFSLSPRHFDSSILQSSRTSGDKRQGMPASSGNARTQKQGEASFDWSISMGSNLCISTQTCSTFFSL